MGRKPIVGGNWKSNPGKLGEAVALIEAWKSTPFNTSAVDVVIAPVSIHIMCVKEGLAAQGMQVAAQNVGACDAGAFTGEWTAGMLADLEIPWTIVGHSERRTKYGETDEETAIKTGKALAAGLKVIVCIGETLEERESGKTDEVNRRQLGACIPKITNWENVVIAYEPVWAIGTGKVATPEQAQETIKSIRDWLASAVSADVAAAVRIQYGGSASPDNAADLMKQPDIDGFLVGGASLKPAFTQIIAACAAAA